MKFTTLKLIALTTISIASCTAGKSRLMRPLPSQKEITFDSLAIGDSFVYELKLHNPNPADTLHIKQARASCGCTVASLHDKTIAPLSFASARICFRAEKEGLHEKSVIFETDSDTPYVSVLVKGKVIKDLKKSPKP